MDFDWKYLLVFALAGGLLWESWCLIRKPLDYLDSYGAAGLKFYATTHHISDVDGLDFLSAPWWARRLWLGLFLAVTPFSLPAGQYGLRLLLWTSWVGFWLAMAYDVLALRAAQFDLATRKEFSRLIDESDDPLASIRLDTTLAEHEARRGRNWASIALGATAVAVFYSIMIGLLVLLT